MKRDKRGNTKKVTDTFHKVRKERLHTLRDNVELGREPMYDFEVSMDVLIKSLLKVRDETL